MNKHFLTIRFISLLLMLIVFSCQPSLKYTTTYSSQSIDSTNIADKITEQLIEPYKEILDKEMNEVLVYSELEMPKEKGKPETLLGNFVCDLSIRYVEKKSPEYTVDICLLNIGGLRTSLPKGEITRGKIFELMPFDNELVIVAINKAKAIDMLNYLKEVGGQPIGKALLNLSQPIENQLKNLSKNDTIHVLTSDYLALGGDKMNFFLNPLKTTYIKVKLRDVIINHCIEEHKNGKQITTQINGRLQID